MKSLHVQTIWLNQIKNGRKTIEGRTGDSKKFENWIGEVVLLTDGDTSFSVIIRNVKHFQSLEEYIDTCGWENVAPHLNSREETLISYLTIRDHDGIQVFSPERIKERGGICALHVLCTN